jgi:ArsR family transcriptional regulator
VSAYRLSTVPTASTPSSAVPARVASDQSEAVLLRALGHPIRLGIMRELALQPETCACDFTDLFAVRQPTISQHLKVLREAGLVETRRRGNQICYSVKPDSLARLQQLLASLQPGVSPAARSGKARRA